MDTLADAVLDWTGVLVTATVSRAELLFVPFVLAAFALQLWLTIDVQRDYRRLLRSGQNGGLVRIKRSEMWRERLLALRTGLWVVAVVPLLVDWRYAGLTFLFGALAWAWLTMASAVRDRVYRRRQEAYYTRLATLARQRRHVVVVPPAPPPKADSESEAEEC